MSEMAFVLRLFKSHLGTAVLYNGNHALRSSDHIVLTVPRRKTEEDGPLIKEGPVQL